MDAKNFDPEQFSDLIQMFLRFKLIVSDEHSFMCSLARLWKCLYRVFVIDLIIEFSIRKL